MPLHRVLSTVLVLALVPRSTMADLQDSFDSVRTSWQLREQDCQARVTLQKMDFSSGHAAPGSELVRIIAAQGTRAHLAYPVDRVPVIDELNPTLWLRSDRPDLQLIARIVLPRTRNPRTGTPLEAIVRGEFYRHAGSWQQLRIPTIHRRLLLQAPSLSAEHGIAVDIRQAFVSELLLNIYGGPGVTTVWIDDLSMVTPLVRATPIAIQGAAASEVRNVSLEQAGMDGVEFQGSILLSQGRPLMARVIEYNGEPMLWLRQLGFNTLAMKSYPSLAVRRQAGKLGLWLIAPPPGVAELTNDPDVAYRILAWDLGEGLDSTHLRQLARTAQLIRTIPAANRPLSCAPSESFPAFQRDVDLLRINWQPLFSSLSMPEAFRQLQLAISQLKRGSPYWVSISIDPGEAVERQWQSLAPGMARPGAISLDQLRIAVHRALAAGSRGIYFRSSRRLDTPAVSERQKCRQLEQINLELQLLEPWVAGAGPPRVVTSDTPGVEAVSLRTTRAQLVWIFRPGPADQCVVAGVADQAVSLDITGLPITYHPYLVNGSSIQQQSPVRRDARVQVLTTNGVTLIVITDDPLAINYLKRKEYDLRHRWAELNSAHARALFNQTSSVMDVLPLDQQQRRLWYQVRDHSLQRLARMDQLHAVRDGLAVSRMALDACQELQQARWRIWKATRSRSSSVVSNPLSVRFETLPGYWKFVDRMQGRSWGKNLLPGGEFEDLDAMRGSGWRHYQDQRHDVQSFVELSTGNPHGGRMCLQMKTWPGGTDDLTSSLLTAPAWVQTAAVDVHPGDQVRIQGWVRIERPLDGLGDGLLIYDSAGGPQLALRFHHADSWQPFVIYRGIDQSQSLTVTCALAGLGEVQLDDLSIQVMPGAATIGYSGVGGPR